ncbi:CWC16 protein [Kipferlia bialata]|uniref:CWC16 protein n=1 Tax=Kipferlia bialata TaxID=797122 RepID=A0A9K3D2Z4_9EUKA|nr:CWC16 protein [Kipferlia bialata]|eukprot:g8522.t1
MSVECAKCKGFVRHSTRFNGRKRERYGEAYLGLKTFDFMVHCPGCGNQLVFASDPKNCRYFCVSGCTAVSGHRQRKFKPMGDVGGEEEEEDAEDALERLEKETFDNRAYLQSVAEIDAAIDSSRRAEHVTKDAVDDAMKRAHDLRLQDVDAGIRPVSPKRGSDPIPTSGATGEPRPATTKGTKPGAKKKGKKGGFGFAKMIAKQNGA